MSYAKNMPTVAQQVRTDGGLASALAATVTRLSRRLRKERGSDLTASQLAILGTIRRRGPITIGAVAAHEGVRPPSMTRAINSLVEAGLVTRASSPEDGRQVLVQLSDIGDQRLAAERRRRDQWMAQRLAGLEPEERDLLRRAALVLERVLQE
jgi:DNA-binding MarR family transcriptional regulator